MEPGLLRGVLDALFPSGPGQSLPEEYSHGREDSPVPVTAEELVGAAGRMSARNTVPSPDGVPGKAVVLTLPVLGDVIRRLFDMCLREGTVPGCWKTSKLVLLPKSRKDPDSTGACRPICLLNEMSKLFERVILARITKHLEEVGPDLQPHQYCFRPRRSTIDAIERVTSIIKKTTGQRGIALAVSVHIANAFNSISWDAIMTGLEWHGFPVYIQRLIGSYLEGRTAEYRGKDGMQKRPIGRGVPQGSVIGPSLWNIGYDQVLRAALPIGVFVTCYTDDTLQVACGGEWMHAIRLIEAGLASIIARINSLGLEVATQKMEAVWVHNLPRNRSPPPSWVAVGQGQRIPVGRSMKYLGLTLDGRLTYEKHIEQIAPKLEKTALHLGRLLPNIGGLGVRARRLYTAIIQSMALHGALIWAREGPLSRRIRDTLRKAQRRMALRLIRGYRTVSAEAAFALAGMTPFDHLAKAFAEVYWGSRRQAAQAQEPAIDPEQLKARPCGGQIGVGGGNLRGAVRLSGERWRSSTPVGTTGRRSGPLCSHTELHRCSPGTAASVST